MLAKSHFFWEVCEYSPSTLPSPPPSSHPPLERQRAGGKWAARRVENQSQPRLSSSSLQRLGSAVMSPGTLPYNNLGGDDNKRGTFNFQHGGGSTRRSVGRGSAILDQTTDWEQSVSLCINELGVSSSPETWRIGIWLDAETLHNLFFSNEGGWGIVNGRGLNIPNRLDSYAEQENVELHAVTGRQALLQQRWELLGELLPVLLPHLVLEPVQDLKRKAEAALKQAELHTYFYLINRTAALGNDTCQHVVKIKKNGHLVFMFVQHTDFIGSCAYVSTFVSQ